MTENKIYKLIDLIEDIKKVDGMIALHTQSTTTDLMLSQYQAKKIKLLGHLIHELNSPSLKSGRSLLLIKRLLDKFYGDSTGLPEEDDDTEDLRRLEAAI